MRFSKIYTYGKSYVHREIGFYSLLTGIILQVFSKTDFAKAYSLFTVPQLFALLTNC